MDRSDPYEMRMEWERIQRAEDDEYQKRMESKVMTPDGEAFIISGPHEDVEPYYLVEMDDGIGTEQVFPVSQVRYV